MAKREKKVRDGVVDGGEILRGTRVAIGPFKVGQVDGNDKFVDWFGFGKMVAREGRGLRDLGLLLCDEIGRLTWYRSPEEKLEDVEGALEVFERYRDRLKAAMAEEAEGIGE